MRQSLPYFASPVVSKTLTTDKQRKTGHGDMEWEEALLVAWGGESPLRTSGFFGGKRHEPGGSPKG